MIHVVGHTATDHIFRVPHLPDPNTSTQILDHQIFFGGGAANIAVGIAVLGGESTLVSAVGGDFEGTDYDRWLHSHHVGRYFYIEEEGHTPLACMFTDEREDQITFFEWGASEAFTKADPPAFDFVHMATADPSYNVKVAERAGFASFDPGQDIHKYSAEQFEQLLDSIDILFANRYEAEIMARVLSHTEEELSARVPVAIFTRGKEGSRLYEDGALTVIPSVPVTLVDPTGAGDAYRAGFLTAYQKQLPLEDCCRIGTVCSSFVIEKAGCQTNLPTWELMQERLDTYVG
ncbi:MAG: PfkB domain protein [Methanomicrobiales archaeon 53_19]|jgi:ribokinase|uniref:carbohydrate kinase family protein n=1 Tax=Methanocalculus sp. TaxID=2004547 RepID=UPI0007468103|nr:carbohydrate kinase family protein [Methanocalculus sp.]KUK68950.1 MAG: PfkB domain protein [Methanocalculus sp. 52_23]KUL04668.1 MAG: PfkB domain protein [Methanomicrobiales archaeon 53_19]HIJ06888.1 carbohydrate kinase family protein [Methanocalculus sp.]